MESAKKLPYERQRVLALRAVARYLRFKEQGRRAMEHRFWDTSEEPAAQRRCSKALDTIVKTLTVAYRLKDRDVEKINGFRQH